MQAKPRHFGSYEEGLRISYEEEVAGEAYFAELAGKHQAENRCALLLLAEMEQVTARMIAPLLLRHGIAVAEDAELRAQGVAEARAKSSTAWPDLIARMAGTYQCFVDEFIAIEAMAPPEDVPTLGVLVAHEQAMLSFAIMHQRGDSDCLAPLTSFLGEHRAASASVGETVDD
jgi:hypothetical protein